MVDALKEFGTTTNLPGGLSTKNSQSNGNEGNKEARSNPQGAGKLHIRDWYICLEDHY